MANGESKLKLIHLVYLLVIAVGGSGYWLGTLTANQKKNTDEICEKTDKNIFDMHSKQQVQQFESLEKTIGKGFDNVDKRLETMEKRAP